MTTQELAQKILDIIDTDWNAEETIEKLCKEQLRAKAKELALLIVELTPASREQSLALTELESASMWANAAIARNE